MNLAGTAISSANGNLRGCPNFLIFLSDTSFSGSLSGVTNATFDRTLLDFLTELLTGDLDGDKSHTVSLSESFTVA